MINWKKPFGMLRKTSGTTGHSASRAKHPVAARTATKRHKTMKATFFKTLLDAFPADTSLMGNTPTEIMLDDRSCTLGFKADGLYLDGLKYIITAQDQGPDMPLSILRATRIGKHLVLDVGAWGEKDSLELDQERTATLLWSLLQGKSYTDTAKNGMTIEIARQLY